MFFKILKNILFCVIGCIIINICPVAPAAADDADDKQIPLNQYGVRSLNPYVVERITVDGKEIDKVIVPGPPTPPDGITLEATDVPVPDVDAGTNSIANVPAINWTYGCSPTAAAMMFGHYDNTGYPDMYTGSTNGGVFPMTNASWGSGECPLSATRLGLDGRASRGHVDDYWVAVNSQAQDPYLANGWAQHTYGDCTGDYMGSNQSAFGNPDGTTSFYYYPDGSPLVDYTPASGRDGCHGMKLFAVSRGYTVDTNFSQYIHGYNGNTQGFTFENYKAEIDAGRPVLIQLTGHTVLGFGYNDTNSTIYFHDTWNYDDRSMTWGGTYLTNYTHVGVTVLRLAAASPISSCPDCPANGIIANVTYPSGETCSCSNGTNLTIGTGVTIPAGAIVNFSAGVSITVSSTLTLPSGATATLTAPLVTVEPGFHAAEGATVTIQQP
jgi:peptidase C39-like protein